jgi:tRNA-dihydrouridine synthase
MDKPLYAAPLEGLTTWLWRRVHHGIFGGADKYFTPFLSPNANLSFQTKERREIEHNQGLPVVPQLLTNRAEYFVWAARTLRDMGYDEVNFNLGCPSGTVAAKHKGAGLLSWPEELDRCLEGIYSALPDMKVSVKTRIGRSDPAEWGQLLEIFNRYPISELIVHPRVQKEFYTGQVHRDVFDWTRGHTALPLVYNGDLTAPEEVAACPVPAMTGRGLIRDPALLRRARGGPPAAREELCRYHDALLEGYRSALGDGPALHKMWELWAYLIGAFEDAEPYLKKMRKCRSTAAYAPLAAAVLRDCPLRW